MGENNYQVKDDLPLLERMMDGLKNAGDLYRPTNYWSHYEKYSMQEIRSKGLHNFRGRRNSRMCTFSASDLCIHPRLRVPGEFPKFGANFALSMLTELLEKLDLLIINDFPPQDPTKYYYRIVKSKFEKVSQNLDKCPTSPYGGPEDMVMINGKPWSVAHLHACSMWADSAAHIPYKDGMVFCELGAGMGRVEEVMAQLFPSSTLLIFDIAPQLYVSQQYLTSVFGQKVIGYDEAIKIVPEQGSIPEKIKGKIVILPNWKMPEWEKSKIDIFWNSASFSEMEPNVVRNYLGHVKNMSPEYIFINALSGGNYWGEWKPGQGGTKEKINDEDYIEPLKGTYSLTAEYVTDYYLRENNYKSFIFKK